MRNLIHLNLARNDIGDKGVLELAEASYMSNLTVLHLGDNNLTEAAAQYLSMGKFIVNLK